MVPGEELIMRTELAMTLSYSLHFSLDNWVLLLKSNIVWHVAWRDWVITRSQNTWRVLFRTRMFEFLRIFGKYGLAA